MPDPKPPPEHASFDAQAGHHRTYGGFAAAGEGEALSRPGETRTYLRSELQRRAAPRRASGGVVAGGLAAVIAGGVLAGLAATHERWSPASDPAPPLAPAGPVEVRAATVRADPDPPPVSAPSDLARLTPADVAQVQPAASSAAASPTKSRPRPAARPAANAQQAAVLAALDREVNAAFAQAMRTSDAAGPLAAAQQDWIIRRDRVRRQDPALAEDLYRARIVELQALAAQGGGEPADEAATPVEIDPAS